jgi:hypothetical protein
MGKFDSCQLIISGVLFIVAELGVEVQALLQEPATAVPILSNDNMRDPLACQIASSIGLGRREGSKGSP